MYSYLIYVFNTGVNRGAQFAVNGHDAESGVDESGHFTGQLVGNTVESADTGYVRDGWETATAATYTDARKQKNPQTLHDKTV